MKKQLIVAVMLVVLANLAPAQWIKFTIRNLSSEMLTGRLLEVKSTDVPASVGTVGPGLVVKCGDVFFETQWVPGDASSGGGSLFFVAPWVGPGKSLECEFTPMDLTTRVTAQSKYILPRKDIAWENDRTAHRIYGGPLAGDVRDGIDVWVKRVRYPVMDKWYNGDSLKGKARISYHVDHGEGADYFDVKKSLGAGGSAIWVNGKPLHFGFFRSYDIAIPGPLRTQFTVNYDSAFDGTNTVSCRRTFTLDAGSNLTRIDLAFSGLPAADSIVALGLVCRDGVGSDSLPKTSALSLWGPVDKDTSHGELGTGVVVDPASFAGVERDSSHVYLLARLRPDGTLTYWAGAGWTKSGDFADKAAWLSYLSAHTKPAYQIVFQ